MTISSASAACAMPADGLDTVGDAEDAMIQVADMYSRGLGVRASPPAGRRAPRQPEPAAMQRPAGRGLPEGYLPLSEVTDLTLLGSWPLLEDRMSACMPTRIISAMQRRSSLGDREADTWLRMHARACAGDPDAQRAFGRVCENGSYRTAADLQRAFFWYYRAWLQGDVEARRNAERLMHYAQRISPATMGEPMLIFPGRWRITAHLSPELHSTSLFDLLEDGSAAGSLPGPARAAAAMSPSGPGMEPAADDLPSRFGNARCRGGWAFDGIGQVLTLIFEAEGGERRWRSAIWQIEITGCTPGSLFGRDRTMVGYTLERLTQAAHRDDE